MKVVKLFLLVMIFAVTSGIAQENNTERIIIIKKESEGNDKNEIRVETKEGKDGKVVIIVNGEEIEIDEHSEDFEHENIQIKMILDGEEIELDGDGEKSKEIKVMVEKMTNAHFNDKESMMFIHESDTDRPVMGVEIENVGGNGAIINKIYPESGAEKAGLKVGDIIYKIGKNKVFNVQNVIDVLSKYEIDDEVKVRYIRNGSKDKKKVTLGRMIRKRASPNCFGNSYQYEDFHQMIIKKRKISNAITENPPVERPVDNRYEIQLEYNGEKGELLVEFRSYPGPTRVRIIDREGNILSEVQDDDFDGNFKQTFDLPVDVKNGATLEIMQNGKTIQKKL